ncbi:MAG: DUF6261 family protein [Marinoscillum sp.]
MQMINVPKLRMAQLQTFTEGVLKTTKDLAEVSEQVGEVQTRFDAFKDGMTREDASSDKETLDRTRDLLNSGFFKNVEAEQFFPHEAAAADMLKKVLKVTNDYGFRLNKLTYDEQTAQTDNMLKELEALDLTALPGLSRWLVPLTTANDNFKAVADAYFKELTASGDTIAATKAAPPLTDAINNLFTMLFAHVKISGSEAITAAYKELITQVEAYK